MIYVVAGIAGIVGAVVGWLVTGVLAVWIAGLYGMSDFEGARGMFAFLGVGPIGGLVCMVGTVWLVLRRGRRDAAPSPTLPRVGLVLAGIAAVVGAGMWVRLETIDTYSNEAPPSLEFEVRVPTRMAVTDRSAIEVELHTDRNVGESVFFDPWSRAEGEHQVIAGVVPLLLKTSSRLLVVKLPDRTDRLFRLPLSRDPRSTPALGEWRRADHIATAGDEEVQKAPNDDPVELRFRIRRAGED